MGFTRYWNIDESADADKFANAMADIREMLVEQNADDDLMYDQENLIHWFLSAEGVAFNGIEEDGHETFLVEYGEIDSQFCKTARKPYDKYVFACLLILKHHLGDEISILADDYNETDADAYDLFREYCSYDVEEVVEKRKHDDTNLHDLIVDYAEWVAGNMAIEGLVDVVKESIIARLGSMWESEVRDEIEENMV